MTNDASRAFRGENFAAADAVTATEQAVHNTDSPSHGLQAFTEKVWTSQQSLSANDLKTYASLIKEDSMLPALAIEWGKENRTILDTDGDGKITKAELSGTIDKLTKNDNGKISPDAMLAESLLNDFDKISQAGNSSYNPFAEKSAGISSADLDAASGWDVRHTAKPTAEVQSIYSDNNDSAAEEHASVLARLRQPFDAVKRPDGRGYDMPILEEWYHNVMDTDWEKDR